MQPLFLLHGALGAADQLAPISDALSKSFQTYPISLPGHGGQDFPTETLSMETFATAVLKEMDERKIESAYFFGYSMGGYVAMLLAKIAPERVKKVATLATKYHWDPAIAAGEIRMLNPEKVKEKVPQFAAALEKRHAPTSWEMLMEKTAVLLQGLGEKAPLLLPDYSSIHQPCLLVLGDRDKMVTLEETVAAYKALPDAQLSVLPATPHPIEAVPLELLATQLAMFFKG